MVEIAIISGKGGTGKTSITACYSYLLRDEAVIADCDVDAADMHLLLKPDFANEKEFYGGQIAKINNVKCSRCGRCKDVCRFDAISLMTSYYKVNDIDCEGCGYCANICPSSAIIMEDALTGHLYNSKTRLNNNLVHAQLKIAAENSGKLVTKVRQLAKAVAVEDDKPFVIIDGSPGIGCPVIATITGVDYVVIVTEPTMSGFHDMERVYELVKKFNINAGCVINKYDINNEISNKIKSFLKDNDIKLLAELPYDNVFTKAMLQGKTVIEYDKENIISKNLVSSLKAIKSLQLIKNQ